MPQTMTYRTDENERKNVFRAYLVGPCIHPADPASISDDLKELAELVRTLEVPVAGQVVAGLKAPNPKYFVEAAERFGLKPEECLMVGNDAEEDVAAMKAGMQVFRKNLVPFTQSVGGMNLRSFDETKFGYTGTGVRIATAQFANWASQ